MKKVGFTLAEVLITLGIIGVVAAMTIPNLIQKNQKRIVETRLKEDYSILQQVIQASEGEIVPTNIGNSSDLNEIFNTYFTSKMKFSDICYQEPRCWQQGPLTKALSGVNGRQITENGQGAGSVCARLNNGSNFCLDWWEKARLESIWGVKMPEGSPETATGIVILVDANGDLPPNVVGKDSYFLVYSTELGLVPAGYGLSSEELDENCSTSAEGNTAGYWCMMKVKDNGWTIDDNIWKKKI